MTTDPIFESFLSHLNSLWGGTPGVPFESLLGRFDSFCVSGELGGRPLHNTYFPHEVYAVEFPVTIAKINPPNPCRTVCENDVPNLSGTGDSQRDSRESFAIETPIFITRQADSHESLECPIRANHPIGANHANRFARITPLSPQW